MVELESIGRCRRWRNSNLLDLWWPELVKSYIIPLYSRSLTIVANF